MKFCLLLVLSSCLSACTSFHTIEVSKRITNPDGPNILFIGNSITYHAPVPDIGWKGNHGMAATIDDNDYVHIVSNSLKANFTILSLGDWERAFWHYDYTKLDKYKGWADYVVIKLGENVSEIIDFKKSFTELLKHIDCKNVVVISVWWDKPIYPQINDYMRSVTLENNFQWVELPAHDATYNAINYLNKDLADHPGDKGMRLIADSILKTLPNQLPHKASMVH